MQFGAVTETTTLDDDGSTLSVKKNYSAGNVIGAIRKRFEIRCKVRDAKQEMEEFLQFSDDIRANKDIKREAALRFEYTGHGNENGYYYVVKCWTEIVNQ